MADYLIIILFILGIWGMIKKDNLIKKVIALNIFNSCIVILFIYLGSRTGSTAPIMEKGIKDVVDPLPQALMLTAIVIGICLTALALSLILKIYQHYETLSIHRIEENIKQKQ
ncbi:Na+/H+ antiporter subunit C [Candidatus Aerophobetes bacterium]|uniref:Na+/H+ antiporter subunit C n=1 Tax=Aerophobetes bacterium TaxID=2030807 RepID=A0A662DC24_UNCAE|nr:MAG: Na+/H+ antiporter subunit C [Candidatus Aerophobetes bacterium]